MYFLIHSKIVNPIGGRLLPCSLLDFPWGRWVGGCLECGAGQPWGALACVLGWGRGMPRTPGGGGLLVWGLWGTLGGWAPYCARGPIFLIEEELALSVLLHLPALWPWVLFLSRGPRVGHSPYFYILSSPSPKPKHPPEHRCRLTLSQMCDGMKCFTCVGLSTYVCVTCSCICVHVDMFVCFWS